ncbi:hypothetical protein BLNAU_20109 [Blattamonas nauphoetae]|uniref:Uncharacterized protein n=1 Tax=Blattamonas nauphoetae TaxID=2049346 RepID=A0ABQ9WZI8_9EUKA|nr:hypothetical protein BLNAU_20109 [Blattamonas nauphoetae]
MKSSPDSSCPDSSPFLNWVEGKLESVHERTVVFRSLVATLRLQPAFDDTLEAKAVKLLESVSPRTRSSADDFLDNIASLCDDSSADFVESIVVLISSTSQIITTAALKMLDNLIQCCSAKSFLALVNADLIAQLITALNPLSLSFAEAFNIHTCLIVIISRTVLLTTLYGLYQLKHKDRNKDKAVHETVLTQVLSPSERYIRHLCVNRFSIVDGEQSPELMTLLPRILRICAYYQPTMEFVLTMPVILTIPSCLTFFENENSIWSFLASMVDAQLNWNEQRRHVGQMGKRVTRKLRMEGIEDVIEKKRRNDMNSKIGGWIVGRSIVWINLLGMNVPRHA